MSDLTDEFEDFEDLLEIEVPLPEEIAHARANCFNAVEFYWFDTDELEFMGPEEFVTYLKRNFSQLESAADPTPGDVWVVWSRASDEIASGQLRIVNLPKESAAYPVGLVIEHAFVLLDEEAVFQKRDPTAMGPYELTTRIEALAPYIAKPGFEITVHRRKD